MNIRFSSKISIVVVGLSVVLSSFGNENEGFFDSFTENMRLTVDTSVRAVSVDPVDNVGFINWVGIDMHSVISSPMGGVATATLQGYLTRIDNLERHPGFFDDEDDWEFVYRIFRLDFKPFGNIGGPRIRIGHIETPFGLEHTINTNGTLRGYTNPRNLGLLADWGVGLVGSSSKYIYEALVSRGSGQDYHDRGDPWAFTARIGTDPGGIFSQGVSVFSGRVGGAERWRLAYDNHAYFGAFAVLGEITVGENDSNQTFSGLLEFDWNDRNEVLLTYLQFKHFGMDDKSNWIFDTTASIGARYSPDNHWATSIQYTETLNSSIGRNLVPELSLQMRYRY